MNAQTQHTAFIALSSNDLLGQYSPNHTLFASPSQTLLAQGIRAILPPCEHADLAARASELLRAASQDGQGPAILVGAIPFKSNADASLCIPHEWVIGRGLADQPGANKPLAASLPVELSAVTMMPTPEGYQDNVAQALTQIDASDLDKVVLSRSLTLEAVIDQTALLHRLVARNPTGYTFAINLAPESAERRSLLGASPELLLTRRGTCIVSNPLAGSIPRSSDPVEDLLRANNLLHSEKDRFEHALVINAVAETLRPYCKTLNVPAQPVLRSTPAMWHLSTEIHGELIDPATTSLELALALHPTPAVCGHPRESAREFIEAVEGFDRGFFAGLVGWCDENGDGEWAVTIRCAEIGETELTLYAGAGIVAGSEPELELNETSAKLRTMLSAMQLEHALDGAL